MNTQDLKKDFPVLAANPELAYLDNAASSQTPQDVIRAMDDYYQTKRANVHRGVYKLSESATTAYEKARGIVAGFLGAEAREVVFTKSTTESLNVLARALTRDLHKGDEILVSAMEHHANFIPWQQMAKERGLKLRVIPLTDAQELDMIEFTHMINDRTRIVAITWISNALGVVNPVEEIIKKAHEVEARVVIDAAQVVGHMPINVHALDIDFLAFSGHKMFGPTGIGVMFGRAAFLQQMEPVLFGGEMIGEVSFEQSSWRDIPYRFEAGTPPIAEAIGLGAAVEYIQKIGLKNIEAHLQDLSGYAYGKLTSISGVRLWGAREASRRSSILSFTVEGVHPHDLATLMDQRQIAIRAGHHCAMPLMNLLGVSATARISLHVYNTKEEVDRACAVIKKAQELFNSRS